MNYALAALIFTLLVGVLMPLPSWVALLRKHPEAKLIYALNLALVWTGIGWLALLGWAAFGWETKVMRDAIARFRQKTDGEG